MALAAQAIFSSPLVGHQPDPAAAELAHDGLPSDDFEGHMGLECRFVVGQRKQLECHDVISIIRKAVESMVCESTGLAASPLTAGPCGQSTQLPWLPGGLRPRLLTPMPHNNPELSG